MCKIETKYKRLTDTKAKKWEPRLSEKALRREVKQLEEGNRYVFMQKTEEFCRGCTTVGLYIVEQGIYGNEPYTFIARRMGNGSIQQTVVFDTVDLENWQTTLDQISHEDWFSTDSSEAIFFETLTEDEWTQPPNDYVIDDYIWQLANSIPKA